MRGALVGGAAYAAGKHSAAAAQRENEQEQAISDLQAQQAQQAPAPQAPPPAAPTAGASQTDQLSQLADMRAKGLLSEEEFTAAKARLLGL